MKDTEMMDMTEGELKKFKQLYPDDEMAEALCADTKPKVII